MAKAPRRMVIEMNEVGSVTLDSLMAQTGRNGSTVVAEALTFYALLRGMADKDGVVQIMGWDGKVAKVTMT